MKQIGVRCAVSENYAPGVSDSIPKGELKCAFNQFHIAYVLRYYFGGIELNKIH